MKSFLIWVISVLAGACTGYILSLVLEVNIFLLIGIGVIMGSSAGITCNIHRERVDHESEALAEDAKA
ncbi:MAG: hypothetical protein RI564_03705 [Gracilimonas sp.]|nr:hypothetical protein [Gracilimonas sp.]